ncbi:protein NRT1/ PTR FAMILY 6.2-like [Telopea speciosissima]|uniref:protein NRT1/ PTR FAMILY 6.2-like n=1 Tax=Telopea speciosissima TaxID=54955 RepID=UPI001CC74ADE|nr:protein NRT1/ PTR FAMILY 6.2-like [Telopea speciosissima]
MLLCASQEGKMNPKISYAIDYKGQPADKTKTRGWLSAALILIVEACERFTTMGIACNLVTYAAGTMHLPSATAANIVTNFSGATYMVSLFGGFMADTFLGRYWTISISAMIETLGVALLAISTIVPGLQPPPCNNGSNTCVEANGLQVGVMNIALYIVAVGAGGLKSNVSGFGTDQFDAKDEKERSQMAYFFSRFYFVISLGTLLGVTMEIYIQDYVSRAWGYGICSIVFFVGIMAFLSRTRRYRYKKCMGSPIIQILQVLVASVCKRNLKCPSIDTLYDDSTKDARIHHTDQLRCLDKAAIIDEKESGTNGSVIQNPWKLCSVTKVEEVKMMVRLIPVWASTIFFWTIHAQLLTFSVEQASTMDRSIGNFQIPAGSFNTFYIAGILVSSVFYDRIIITMMKRWKGKHGLIDMQRIAIGIVFSIVAMIVAAIVETRRISVAKSMGGNVTTLPLNFGILIPQFFLVGVGEAFMYNGQLDFFITRAPKGMKSMSTGLFLSTVGLGFFVSSLLVSIVNKVTGTQVGRAWLTSNINYGKLYYFYALLAVLSFINLVFFVHCAIWYTRTKKNDVQIESIVSSSEEEEKHAVQMEGIRTTSAQEDC